MGSFHFLQFNSFFHFLLNVIRKKDSLFLFLITYNETGIPVDQLNFLIGQCVCLLIGGVYQYLLPPKPITRYSMEQSMLRSQLRHLVSGVIGWSVAFYCFGSTIYWLLLQNVLTYLVTFFVATKYLPHFGLSINIFIMSVLHIRRMIYDYEGYNLDITGPLMISTQKMTGFIMSYYDGIRHKGAVKKDLNSPLNGDQMVQSIRARPSLIQFFGYSFYFHGILVGPLCSYHDYKSFIEGTNLPNNGRKISAKWAIFTKLSECLFYLPLTVIVASKYPTRGNLSFNFLSLRSYIYLLVSQWLQRPKYYFAWLLGDAVNNAAGLGFSGFDQNTDLPKWDLVTNVNIPILETATSFKILMDYWNIGTKNWLRRICYDRAPVGRTALTYVLSALWHGFYPGYYITFIGAALGTYAGRSIRKSIRPIFANNRFMICYSALTWIMSHLVLAYYSVFFVLLSWDDSLKFLNQTYWIVPIVTTILIIVLPHRSLGGIIRSN
ncbi:hypothetical protein SNEBB_007735 [Seison nebaliae]|nr:hypothetical protein SNEBB_007735 [Seison nebaliae]